MRLVSIILPSYNGDRYIARSIESCLAQTYNNFELIIVNDCSTDRTLAIAEEYARKDARIRVVTNTENQNLPRSLNIGFGQAKGDYFTWTSDDNLYAPTAVQELVKRLEESGSDIVYSSYTMIDEKGAPLNRYARPVEGLLFGCVVGPCFLYKNEVHHQLGGYNPQMFRAEDMDFWLRAAVKFSLHYFDNSDLYRYRLHQSSLSTQIYTDQNNYLEHRTNYKAIFRRFFLEGLQFSMTDEQAEDYTDLFFFDKEYAALKQKSNLSHIITRYLALFDEVKKLDWRKVNFSTEAVVAILDQKRDTVIQTALDNVLLENSLLRKENPRLARNFSHNVSWYYKEYEVLPGWFKKLGHLIKVLQGNKRVLNLGRKGQAL
jgi:glycosyltransferase involved in cell wall biosynthesis